MVEIDDQSIIKQVQEGNVDAFALIVERYQQTIFNLAFHMTGNEEESKDLTQEIFLKAYLNLDRVDPQYKFFSWLYRIGVNETVNYLRRRESFVPMEELHLAGDTDMGQKVNQKAKSSFIKKTIRELKPKYRLLIVMKYYSGMSYEQMSAITGLPEKKVKSRLFDARQTLRNLINQMAGQI